MDASCTPTEAATDGGSSDPPKLGLARTEHREHVESLVSVSLLLAGQESREVQGHGCKMLRHLLKYRSEELSNSDLQYLTLQYVYALKRLVPSPESDGRSNSSNGFACSGNNHSCCPAEIDGSTLGKSDGSSLEKSAGGSDSSSSMSELKPDLSDRCAKATPNDETISCNQGMDCLLLIEHNLLCEAFVTATSCWGNQQYMSMLPCLLNSLNGIWTQREWSDRYVDSTLSGPRVLFFYGQFLKMSYHVVKFCEERLTRGVKKEEDGACDVFPIALLQSTLPLFFFFCRQFRELYSNKRIRWAVRQEATNQEARGLIQPTLSHTQCARTLCTQALWTLEIDVGWLPQEVDLAKSLSCEELGRLLEISDGLYTIDSEESFLENETRALLEGTRQRAYNFIGLCTTVEGAFSNLLDSLSVGNALTEALECMELRHLGKLIHLVVVPLVKHCPSELWEEWTVNFLEPVLFQCELRLHVTWYNLMCDIETDDIINYGNLVGEDEQIKELRCKLLLEFTRRMSGLLEALALMEQTSVPLHEDVKADCDKGTGSSQDANSTSPTSLFRFLLRRGCFGKLRMNLFGYFVDDEAAIKAVPFCRCLIGLAVSTNDVRLRLFIVDDVLQCLIRRLDNQLQCAVQRLMQKMKSSTTVSADQELLVLCEDLYVYLIKDSDGEDKDSYIAKNKFKSWLTKEKGNLQVKACSPAKELPDGSPWNWEFEDEFQRYLPAYMEMLQQVDSMSICDENDYLREEAILQKLGPEFRSKYGINSCEHPYMVTISSLWRRHFSPTSCILYHRKKIKFISELIKLKPYIKVSDSCSSLMCRLQENSEASAIICHLQEKSEIPSELPECYVFASLDILKSILSLWEPVYHPLIRESHMAILLRIVDQYIKANESEHCQQVVPDTLDFDVHLMPYAYAFMETKLEENMYSRATEQIRLHKEFDTHLASGGLDHRVDEFILSNDDFVKNLVKDEIARMEFSDLDDDLIKLSLERRALFAETRRLVCTYSSCLQSLLENKSLQGHIDVLMNELEIGGFFDTDNDSINWENECFSELVNQFGVTVFAGHSLPKHYVVRGIMDYRSILLWNPSSGVDPFKVVVGNVCDRWIESCEMWWMETRYYEHAYYNTVRRPLEHVFLK